ncbi:MAG: hypothetical protein QOD69_52 [Solirubrobacteraceae bacterium]|nr:hypothetical protein [Solirubrobacteraceae bacterium]
MTAAPPHYLTREEILALKYAAHRQLARWVTARPLHPRQRERRTALVTAVRTLEDPAFAHGCELRLPTGEG